MGFKEEEERPRPEFAAKAPFLEKNPITGIKEPHFPDNLRLKRVVVGTGLICFMVRIITYHYDNIQNYIKLNDIYIYKS